MRELKDRRDNKSGGNKKLTETIALLEMENEILISMSTYEKEVKGDKEYMTAYYPIAFQLYNNGGLTLVSKKYIQWAKALIVEINQHISMDKIWEKKKVIIRESKEHITSNERLFNSFQRAVFAKPALEAKVIRKCHTEIVTKVINARAGNVFQLFQMFFVGHYSKKKNVELRKTLQVQAKSKHQTKEAKKEEEIDADEDEYKD